MTNKLFKIMATSALSGALLLAQGPGPGGPHRGFAGGSFDSAAMQQRHLDMLSTALNLTDAQKQQAADLFKNAAQSGQASADSMKQARQALQDAVKANSLAQIDAQAAIIGTLTGQNLASESKAQAAFYAILTPDQQQKLNDLHANHR